MPPSDLIGIQRLVDRVAIHDALARYFHGADGCDEAQVRGCFTQDVEAHYEGRPPALGLDALIDQIAVFRNLASGACTVCTHFMGNLHFRHLDASSAESETYAIAFLVTPARGEHTVDMRSLRYLDCWRREPEAWKISTRTLTLDWSAQVRATFVREFAQRVANPGVTS